MPFPTNTTYPPTATNTAWQKKKSFLDKAKAKNKTGVGPALVAAEAAWDEIKFADLDESKNKPTTSAAAAISLNKAQAAAVKVKAAQVKLKAAIKIATTQSVNKDLSATTKTALKTIATDLTAAEKRLDLMDDLVPMFQVDHNNLVKEEHDKVEAAKAKAHLARATLSHVEIKSGSSILGTAPSAKRQADNGYWATDVTWKGGRDFLSYLQQELTLEGHAADGAAFSEKMKLIGVVGDMTFKFK